MNLSGELAGGVTLAPRRLFEKNLMCANPSVGSASLVCFAILPIRNLGCAELTSGAERFSGIGFLREEMARMTKILLVDDSKFLLLATERALARAGYEVMAAKDGETALEIARERLPDVILLDMLLPKMTGPDVLKALKKDPATAAIPVVVLTGLSHKNAERLQHDGAYAFLEKSALELDKGCEPLLTELAGIMRQLKLATPPGALAAK